MDSTVKTIAFTIGSFYINVELNRYAVGVGEWIGVGPCFVSCECDGLAGSGCIDWSEDSDLRQADL